MRGCPNVPSYVDSFRQLIAKFGGQLLIRSVCARAHALTCASVQTCEHAKKQGPMTFGNGNKKCPSPPPSAASRNQILTGFLGVCQAPVKYAETHPRDSVINY